MFPNPLLMLLRYVLFQGVYKAMRVTEPALSHVTGVQARAFQLHANKFTLALSAGAVKCSVHLLYSYY